MTCESITAQLPLLVYGELTFDEEEAVEQHLAACADCRTELGRVHAMHEAFDARQEDVSSDLLLSCRRELRLGLSARQAVKSRGLFGGSWLWLAKPVGALALVAIGFFGARYYPGAQGPAARLRPSEPVASRVRYVEPDHTGQVRIVIEEVRQRTLSGDMEDEPIRRVLLAAARESADPGIRVESMDLLKTRPKSEEVRLALLHALQHDANPGVRLKAMEGLRDIPVDGATQRALTHVLLNDKNPGVRTQAIDLLIRRKEPSLAGLLQELVMREDNSYIRMRAQDALKDMKASPEMF